MDIQKKIDHNVMVQLLLVSTLLAMSGMARSAEHRCESSAVSDGGSNSDTWIIVATDHGYDAPKCIAAGLRHIKFQNRGSEIHEAMFIKLPDRMTADQYIADVQDGIEFPEGALDYSGPGLTSPGHKVDFWLRLDPGNYLLFCWYRGHSETLPVQKLEVISDGSPDSTQPEVDVIIRQLDFRFEVLGNFRSGLQTIQFETPGPSMHEADIYRLNDGRDVEDLRRWQKSGKEGPAPAITFGGALDNHDIGRIVWLKTDLQPGRYVLWCGMPMSTDPVATASEVSHSDIGMVHEFIVD